MYIYIRVSQWVTVKGLWLVWFGNTLWFGLGNKILGRESTPEEVEFLKTADSWGQ